MVIVAAFFITSTILAYLSLRSSNTQHGVTASAGESSQGGLGAYFSFHTPFSLFPPNAIISLTDDNTTSFLARPAAFGPPLPAKGLSGQLWIGSGFGDDSLRQGSVAAGAEGELGCSDVPGWADESAELRGVDRATAGKPVSAKMVAKIKNPKRSGDTGSLDHAASNDIVQDGIGDTKVAVNDGTDDYLHHPLPSTPQPPRTGQRVHTSPLSSTADNHADIQSIQEGAEIAGKVVLLSRGGCGFSEKVKWVQRRGGTALIVGDDTRGGPLIQMYARGDTSNITIPSVFTSHTTAHLLSSLIPPGSFIEDIIDENGNVALKVQQSNGLKNGKKSKKVASLPTFTATTGVPKPTSTSKAATRSKKNTVASSKVSRTAPQKQGWLKSLFGRPSGAGESSDSSRPPSSGRLDWVLVNDWKEVEEETVQASKIKSGKNRESTPNKGSAGSKSVPGDDFVIGVQDWRDPDLVGETSSKNSGKKGSKGLQKVPTAGTHKSDSQATNSAGKKLGTGNNLDGSGPKGGSITPGSGEYGSSSETVQQVRPNEQIQDTNSDSGFLAKIFGEDDDDVIESSNAQGTHAPAKDEPGVPGEVFAENDEIYNEHEGLWVTLVPTSGGSPFFDTLLVLVVSPLVTLTVVYAMLLVRSRIRRRRWRAPKSVVERLPVRTYHTLVSPANQSPRAASPTSTSPTTPLLQASSSSRPRPRSRTVTGAPEITGHVSSSSEAAPIPPRVPARAQEHEKGSSMTSEWRKFMGKQVECVVCLEEYVDGVSQVMSLPCGHEFHADCM
jgi:hypothetical protein